MVLFAALGAEATSHAHALTARRSISFEAVGATELHVLVQLEVPAGKPATALALSFDLDRSGALDADEEERLSRHLTARALTGLGLKIDGRRTSLSQAKSELRRTARGGLELMVYGKLEVSTDLVSVELGSVATAEPASVWLLGGPRPIRKGFGVPSREGGFRAELRPAGRIHFELAPL